MDEPRPEMELPEHARADAAKTDARIGASEGTTGVRVVLKSREEARVLRGHKWVFSNEIDKILGEPQAGGVVEIVRQNGKFVGLGFYNPQSLIAVRLLTTQREPIDKAFFIARLRRAHNDKHAAG